MRKFVVVVEQGEKNYSAYSPDVPGCVATGATVDETLKNMAEAIRFHLKDRARLKPAWSTGKSRR